MGSFDFIPYFRNERDGLKRSEDYKIFAFSKADESIIASSIINSTIFYLYYITYSDTYHCGRELILEFPINISDMLQPIRDDIVNAHSSLMNDMKNKSTRSEIQYKNTGMVEFDKFYPKQSKEELDQIDFLLANHYGFSDQEIDFIINYDIKYRMGLSSF